MEDSEFFNKIEEIRKEHAADLSMINKQLSGIPVISERINNIDTEIRRNILSLDILLSPNNGILRKVSELQLKLEKHCPQCRTSLEQMITSGDEANEKVFLEAMKSIRSNIKRLYWILGSCSAIVVGTSFLNLLKG